MAQSESKPQKPVPPTHSKIRSARQKQTEITYILGKKLQRPLLSPYRWNAGWSGSIMETLDRQVYPANKSIEIFYRINPSTNYFTIVLDLFAKLKFPAFQFCKKPEYPFYKTERQGTIRNTGKVSSHIYFILPKYTKVIYK